MKYRYWIINSLLLFLCAIGFVNASEKEYMINQVCENDSSLILEAVVNSGDKTVIKFKYVNSSMVTDEVSIFPQKHKEAYFIRGVGGTKKYPILNAKGIATNPEWTKIKKGESLKFSLTFERVPMTKFDLIEGDGSQGDLISWHFMNVELKD